MYYVQKKYLITPKILCVIVIFLCTIGCSTMPVIDVPYKPKITIQIQDQNESLGKWRLHVLPVKDSRMIPEKVQLKIKDIDPRRVIGWWGEMMPRTSVFLIKRPFTEVFYDALIYEMKNAGYSVIKELASDTMEGQSIFNLECILKYAHATSLVGMEVETWAGIKLSYRITDSSGAVIHNGYLEEKTINKEGLISSPEAIGDALINMCLPQLIEKLIKDVDVAINNRPL